MCNYTQIYYSVYVYLDYVLYSISYQQIIQIMCVHIHIIVQKVHVYPVNMVLLDNMNPKHTYSL